MIFSASAAALNCQTKAADEKAKSCEYLSFADAEKILGRQVEMVTNSWFVTADITRIECVYRAARSDRGREINLFFLVEENSDVAAAEQVYETIWQSNKNHQGVEVLSGIGDRAYWHSDPPNFHFLLARKERFTIRLKVNKAVEKISPEEIKAAARRIIEQL